MEDTNMSISIADLVSDLRENDLEFNLFFYVN